MTRFAWGLCFGAVFVIGCDEAGAKNAQKALRDSHYPAVLQIIKRDMESHRVGIVKLAERVAPGFALPDPADRERQMRLALRYLQKPPKGIAEFVTSPMSFAAAVDKDGIVIARDAEPDRMKGENFAKRFPVVAKAIKDGEPGYGLGEFPGAEGEKSSFSMLFVQPVDRDGERMGAVVVGIPLWRMAQRLSRQLRLDNAAVEGLVVMAYIYKGDGVHHKATPPEVDEILPDVGSRKAGLAKSPEGFTSQIKHQTRWFAFGVFPTPDIGDDAGVILCRSDPY